MDNQMEKKEVGLNEEKIQIVVNEAVQKAKDNKILEKELDSLCDKEKLQIEEKEQVYIRMNELKISIEEEPNEDVSKPIQIETSSDDSIKIYLRDIGKFPLLTKEEEQELAQIMAEGTAAKEMVAQNEEEQKEIDRKIEAAKRARQRLIQTNLRLVVNTAKKFTGRGIDFLDLIQEGNLGLMKAVGKFDHAKGFKFSTYATWWIKQGIIRAIADKARTIRIPVHMVETINKVKKAQRYLLQELGREPTTAEIAAKMELPVEKIEEIQRINLEPVSLEKPIGEEEDSCLVDFIEDQDTPSPTHVADQRMLRALIEEVLSSLSPRENQVMRKKYGLDDGKSRTLEAVGKEFNVTRERIRQIEAKAISRLRRHPKFERLKDFLD